jgi:hypothetical protein
MENTQNTSYFLRVDGETFEVTNLAEAYYQALGAIDFNQQKIADLHDITFPKQLAFWKQVKKDLEYLMANAVESDDFNYFEHPKFLPTEIKTILDSHQQAAQFEDAMDYKELARLLEELQGNGWTFEYGFDAVPYGLRPMTEDELEQLEK